jgi:hypothetical protein
VDEKVRQLMAQINVLEDDRMPRATHLHHEFCRPSRTRCLALARLVRSLFLLPVSHERVPTSLSGQRLSLPAAAVYAVPSRPRFRRDSTSRLTLVTGLVADQADLSIAFQRSHSYSGQVIRA